MKYLVLSDTHGVMGRVYEVIRNEKDLDGIIHLGDLRKDSLELEKRLDIPVYGVMGNCDGAKNHSEASRVIETEAGKILLTHGHLDGVNFDITNLMYRALENQCVAAFFGHTHVQYLEDTGEVILMNPGSLTKPRDGSNGSYAIAEIIDGKLECKIVNYKKAAKVQGGYIKGLINYSDRF